MPPPPATSPRLPHLPWLAGLGVLALLLAAWLLPRLRPAGEPAGPTPVLRNELELRASRLYRCGTPEPFTGVMIERYPNGKLQSRSQVVAGQLEGLSEGWHPNGHLAVREQFHTGISDGLRVKWRPDGAKLSEATIVQGHLEGRFRRWHANGVLAEEVIMHRDQPEGSARAWYPSGFLRSHVITHEGKVVRQETWPDGERREETAASEADTAPPQRPS